MMPVLFKFGPFTIYAYGLLIGLGIVLGVMFLTHYAKKDLNVQAELINQLLVYLVIAGFVGGKVLLIAEDPKKYLASPFSLLSGSGFVFYGSLLFCFGVLFWFLKKHRITQKPFLDLIAMVTCIIHVFGRFGCFMAGCCYGTPFEGDWAVTFTHPKSAAPLHCALHPVQLYESVSIAILLLVLYLIYRNRKFTGQIFALYLMGYPLVRFFTEMYRGDAERGFLMNGTISHSQLISVGLFLLGVFLYMKWRKPAS